MIETIQFLYENKEIAKWLFSYVEQVLSSIVLGIIIILFFHHLFKFFRKG